MENYQLMIKAYDRPGSLERILRVIRHRGGKIKTMNMQVESTQQLSVNFELVDSRVKEQLANQLIKLADIVTVN
ncbi:acetolactate synthase 2 small subunit [Orbus mooreae]|uniref:acetolactate synthase 2 small subunit n=1 Tax=Orbus mooreae TaxID=3074107 RepID=UPI00370D5E62